MEEAEEDDDDELLEICVESLVGTFFEMRLSRHETIASIKARLQSLEGIPRSQMHLLYRGTELPDASSLEQCQVEYGATLQLILALRGGPINTRRIQMPVQHQQTSHSTSSAIPPELQRLVAENREELMDKMPKNGQVTVLMFREGDQLNLYHVLERQDGTFSPLSDSWSGNSIKNLLSENDQENNPELESRLRENARTMNKMTELRNQLESLNMARKEREKKKKKNPSVNAKKLNTSNTAPSSGRRRKDSGRKSGASSKRPRSNKAKKGLYRQPSFQGSVALPPIKQNDNISGNNVWENNDLGSSVTTTTIFPLSQIQGAGSRRSSNALPPPTMLKPMETVPEWLQRNRDNFATSANNDNIEEESLRDHGGKTAPDIDLIDLKLDTLSELEVVRRRKTKRLISTDIASLKRDLDEPLVRTQRQLASRRTTAATKTRALGTSSSAGASASGDVLSGADDVKLDGEVFLTPKESEREPKSVSKTSNPSAKTLIDDLRGTEGGELIREAKYGRRVAVDASQGTQLSMGNRGSIHRATNGEDFKLEASNGDDVRVSPRLVERKKSGKNMKSFRPHSSKQGRRTPRPRCALQECRKRLNITNGFGCRCQHVFCAKHRHPEVHACTFDYKEEGRKMLEKANPIVTFPKLPKI